MNDSVSLYSYYDYHEIVEWLSVARPGAARYIKEKFDGMDNGRLSSLDIGQNMADMREFPESYSCEPYTIDDLEWLLSEIGDTPRIHYWY